MFYVNNYHSNFLTKIGFKKFNGSP
uniref:Uncharacterized protein n=1 Tax=Anguilla anguilla TaxID=7936 RepID=A0A0E9SU20_ANGAN